MNFTQQNAKFVINFTSVCEVSAYRTRVSHNFDCKNDTRVARETERESERVRERQHPFIIMRDLL